MPWRCMEEWMYRSVGNPPHRNNRRIVESRVFPRVFTLPTDLRLSRWFIYVDPAHMYLHCMEFWLHCRPFGGYMLHVSSLSKSVVWLFILYTSTVEPPMYIPLWSRYPRNLIRWLEAVVSAGRCLVAASDRSLLELPDWDSNPVGSVDYRYLALPSQL
jgi:hypothetical protein